MTERKTRLDEARGHYARMMAAASGSSDPRIERAFEETPREAFLPPGPWRIGGAGRIVVSPSDDPTYVYQNVLVALDPAKGINNGEPFLHAGWIGAVAPQPGEGVVHIGAGMGYYTAILATLVQPNGTVTGFEIEPSLAESARRNLQAFSNVTIVEADATDHPLEPCDIIYVNAGVVAPPVAWLEALREGGRLVFPWQPSERIGIAMLVTRKGAGFAAKAVSPAWFIPCIGASDRSVIRRSPTYDEAWRSRSVVPTSERAPDESATAVYDDLWFSRDPAGD
ncbi:MAG: protein-L-isoaspartate O-methyltransferase [Rhizobiaceae bacterium]